MDNFLFQFINQNPFEFDIYSSMMELQEKFEIYIESKKLQKIFEKKVLNATGMDIMKIY